MRRLQVLDFIPILVRRSSNFCSAIAYSDGMFTCLQRRLQTYPLLLYSKRPWLAASSIHAPTYRSWSSSRNMLRHISYTGHCVDLHLNPLPSVFVTIYSKFETSNGIGRNDSTQIFLASFLLSVKVKDKVVPVLKYLCTTPWRRMGSGCIDPHFLDLGTSWRWVVSFTPRVLYPRGRRSRYPLDRRVDGLWAGPYDVEKRKFLTLPGLELQPLGRPARSQSLYRLSSPGSISNERTII
jgi:hypothetical protein